MSFAVIAGGCGDDPELSSGRDSGVVPAADSGPPLDSAPAGIAVLGNGSHQLTRLSVKEVASAKDGLKSPSDVALHPTRKDELWITSQADDSMVIIFKVGQEGRQVGKTTAASGQHFLANPSGLAFNTKTGALATCHEEDQITQPSTPADFMGPTLWSSNLTVFDGGHSGHMDMLHNTPNGMGIAWEKGNAYWIFDGYHASLTRYDFQADHGPGGSDHRDGIIDRYAEGLVKRVADVPSQLEMDHASGLLYVADTGNNRIAVLDATSATAAGAISPNYDGATQTRMTGAKLTTLVDGKTVGLKLPSGLAIRGGVIYLGDNGTGKIHAFDLKTGAQRDWLDTGLPAGALRGINFDAEGRLYLVDGLQQRVLRLTAAGK